MSLVNVYTFGDKIPPGLATDFFVAYTTPDMPGGLLSGPYRTKTSAEEDMHDIASYESVTNVKLLGRGELSNT